MLWPQKTLPLWGNSPASSQPWNKQNCGSPSNTAQWYWSSYGLCKGPCDIWILYPPTIRPIQGHAENRRTLTMPCTWKWATHTFLQPNDPLRFDPIAGFPTTVQLVSDSNEKNMLIYLHVSLQSDLLSCILDYQCMSEVQELGGRVGHIEGTFCKVTSSLITLVDPQAKMTCPRLKLNSQTWKIGHISIIWNYGVFRINPSTTVASLCPQPYPCCDPISYVCWSHYR